MLRPRICRGPFRIVLRRAALMHVALSTRRVVTQVSLGGYEDSLFIPKLPSRRVYKRLGSTDSESREPMWIGYHRPGLPSICRF
jgi:hypothetical protein